MRNLKPIRTQGAFGKSLLLSMFILLCSTMSFANPADLQTRKNSDERLRALYEQPHSSVYLTDEGIKTYGDAPTTLYANAQSLPLGSKHPAFSTVELMVIRVSKPADEAAKIDMKTLTAFTALRYILFVYEYDAKAAPALPERTAAKLSNADEGVELLYLLSIPQ